MASYPHPQSGPQEPPFIKNSHTRNQEYTRTNSGYHQHNFTQPILSGHGPHNQNFSSPAGLTHPPPQIDVPPYREPHPHPYYQGHPQVIASRPNFNTPMNFHAARNVNTHISNSPNNSGHLQSVESTQQPPELPPKPHSGQHQQHQQHQQQPQQPQQQSHLPPPQQQPHLPPPQQQPHLPPPQQLQINQQQMYQPSPMHQHMYPSQERQHMDPYPYQPPPVPDRPGQQPHVQVKEQQVYDKQKTNVTIDQVDLTASNQLEELSNNPMVVAARLKKLTEVLSAVPEKYEAAIQSKARKFQELTTRAHQDLYVLKEELQKAKTALNSTETNSHALRGELQVVKQENQQLRQQIESEPIDFSNEETQFLIKDLRKQIMNLQLEVPDPNLCDSLRLMIKLMDEDRKVVEKKYTEVTNELHDRDNEISRLMTENQVSGNFIQGGQIGLEKQFNAILTDLRKRNSALSQQLEFANQKLEVNLRRDATENEPGPSRVELSVMVENARSLNDKLQENVREKEEEIVRVKKQLESSRDVMSSSPSHFEQSNSVQNNKEDLIKVLLGEKQTLEKTLEKSQVEVEKLKPLEEKLMIYTNWLNGRDTYIKQLQDNISQKENDVARYRVKSEDLERELNQSNRTKDELLRSEQHYRTKNQQLEALRTSGSSVNVTEERYAERMKKTADMGEIQTEKQKLQKLEQSLDDLKRQNAQLMNQQQLHDADYRSPRYNHTPPSYGAGSGIQGRDRGVPHPPN